MSWLSKTIRKIRKGKIGRFFDKHLDEMLTVGGFALGGPAGAGIGRAIGGSIGPEREKTVGGFIKKGLEGYGAGSVANLGLGIAGQPAWQGALGGGWAGAGGGGGGAAAAGARPAPPTPSASVGSAIRAGASPQGPGMWAAAAGPTPTLPAAAGGAAAGGPAAAGGGFFSDPWKMYLATQGLGTAAQTYGAYQQGRAADEQFDFERRQYEDEMERRRRVREALTPLLARMMPQAMNVPTRSW